MQSYINCKFCGNTDKTNPAECYNTKSRNTCPHWLKRTAFLQTSKETIDHPAHYGGDTQYEVIKVLQAWMTPEQYEGFLVGNAVKYLARFRMKGGTEDLKKAQWYLNELVKFKEENPK